MSYSEVAQIEVAAGQFSRGNNVIPLPSIGTGGQTVQASFNGTYGDGAYALRITVQAAESSLIDPDKQYRVTIEEVTA